MKNEDLFPSNRSTDLVNPKRIDSLISSINGFREELGFENIDSSAIRRIEAVLARAIIVEVWEQLKISSAISDFDLARTTVPAFFKVDDLWKKVEQGVEPSLDEWNKAKEEIVASLEESFERDNLRSPKYAMRAIHFLTNPLMPTIDAIKFVTIAELMRVGGYSVNTGKAAMMHTISEEVEIAPHGKTAVKVIIDAITTKVFSAFELEQKLVQPKIILSMLKRAKIIALESNNYGEIFFTKAENLWGRRLTGDEPEKSEWEDALNQYNVSWDKIKNNHGSDLAAEEAFRVLGGVLKESLITYRNLSRIFGTLESAEAEKLKSLLLQPCEI